MNSPKTCWNSSGWAKGDGTRAGVKRNSQILSPLDFLAEFTQHIPPKGSHLIRYYGWYSNKSRGMRKKAEAETSVESSSEESAATGSSQAWAMLIKRVYEVNPLECPECGGQMQLVSFIEPPQADVIEEIHKHSCCADKGISASAKTVAFL